MAITEKELEKQLKEAGNGLLSPPSSVTEILALLDRIENFLTRVEQSPSEAMKKALSTSMEALVANDLLRHANVDVKVAVASCISEITRITAPDAPYEDDQMKEVFQLIVSSFEKLDDKSSPSYIKRISILETVAKVRSCVVMLDLECDALILEMFQHFFKTIRDDHPENVFSSMETIMNLVLEESEDISLVLLSSILDFVKTDDKEVLPLARHLAEKVIEKCASKLKPYLLPAVKFRGASIDDYSKVVANVLETEPEVVGPSDRDATSKNLGDESDLASVPPPEKPVEVAIETLDDAPPNEEVGPTSVGSPKSTMSNGTLQKEIGDGTARNGNSNDTDHDTHDRGKANVESSKTNTESSGAEKPAKSESKPEKSNKRKGRKTNVLKSTSDPSEPSLTHGKKEAVKVPEHQTKDSNEVDSAKNMDPLVDAAEAAENEKESGAPVSSPKTSENEPVDVPSMTANEKLTGESRSKKVARGKKKGDSVQGEPVGDIDSKKGSDAKKTSDGTGISETKLHKRSGKKTSSAPDKRDKIPSAVDASNKEDDGTDELDAKSAEHLGEKVGVGSQSEDKKKRGQVKATPAMDPEKTPSKEIRKQSLPKSAEESAKIESDAEKSSKTSSKRRRSPEKDKASETKGHGPELVGSKIKVWWPADKKFYEGVVDSFDPVKMRHKVVYNDGDVEILKLAKEKWQLIDDESAADKEYSSDGENPDGSCESPKGKKAKTMVDLGRKPDSAAKKGGGSSSKSKAAPRSGQKQKEESSKSSGKTDDSKGGKSKDSKVGNKSSSDAPKSFGKSKDDDADTPKSGNKSKQDMVKGAVKTKGKSPKSGSKSNSNGTGKVKTGSSSKDEEEEDADMSLEPVKAPEIAKGKSPSTSKSQKSGKKRKRGANN